MLRADAVICFAATVPQGFWLWAAIALLLTAALGFASGVCYARLSVQWAFRRAKTRLSNLYTMVIDTVQTAQEACSLLDKFPNALLTLEQTERLDKRQNLLLDTLGSIVGKQRDFLKTSDSEAVDKPNPDEVAIEWLRSPEDTTTCVPDRSAFDSNLAMLLELGSQTQLKSGLLLIKIDKLDQLEARFGAGSSGRFLQKMAKVVCLAIRDEDLVCRFSADTFGVMIPGVDDEMGRRLVLAVRNTVRDHHFRLDESGPKVLVTASFGYTTCQPYDNVDLALNRAGDALAKSQLRGRNQLHVHDGNALTHCVAQA